MTTIIFKDKNGEEKPVNAEDGLSLMVAAVENGIKGIKALCNGCCSCGTCHIAIEPAFTAKVSPQYSGEQQVLDSLKQRQTNSRLACQIVVDKSLDGMVVIVQ